MKTKALILFIAVISIINLSAQNRWILLPDGSISWSIKNGEAHSDNIEMSGRFISVITTYGVDETGELISSKQLVFPMLRTIPNDTRGNLIYTFSSDAVPMIRINNRPVNEQIIRFSLKGILTTTSIFNNNINVIREFFPSTDKPLAIEKCTIENTSARNITVDVEDFEKNTRSHRERSVYDIYEISAKTSGAGIYSLKPGDKLTFAVLFTGRKISDPPLVVDIEKELSQRQKFVDQMFSTLVFTSPDPVLNRMFDFQVVDNANTVYEILNSDLQRERKWYA